MVGEGDGGSDRVVGEGDGGSDRVVGELSINNVLC